MSTKWPMVKLGEVLSQYTEYIDAPEPREYPKLSVKLYGRGVVLDTPANGAALKMMRHQTAKTGQVVLSEIWGKKGAIGFVPDEGEGALCTSHFFLFDIDKEKLDRRWLQAIFDANYLEPQLDAEAKGTTGYAAVRPKILLDCEIPFPPLSEQRRMVARIEGLAAKINEARGLREKSAEETKALISRATSRLVDDVGWSNQQLGNLLIESPRNGVSPKREVENGGRPMLRINAVSSSPTRFVDLTALKMVEVQDDEAAPFELRYDDVFIVRYNGDINRVAKAAIYKGSDPSRSIFPDKLMRLRPDHSKIIPDFLVYALGSRNVRQQIEQLGKTTAGNIGISGGNAKSFQVPVPSIQDQHRIVAELDAIQSQVDALKKLQTETGAELDALLPSILDKAFKGEL
jgi:type I restriction enzyme S subunit